MVTSGIGKLAGGALAAVPGLGSMGSAAGLLPAAMNPVGAVIVGIVAAIGTLMVASSDFREGVFAMGKALWEGLKPALSSMWELLKTFGSALWEIIKAIGDALGPALKNLAPLLEQIGKLFGQNMAGGADGASSSLGAIVPVITGVIRVIGFLLDITTKVLVPIIEIPLKMAVMAQAALNVVNPLKLLGQAVEWLIGIAQKLWHWITGNSPGLIPAFGQLGQVAAQVAGQMAGVIADKFGQMVGVVADATRQIGSTVSASWSSLASGAKTAGNSMVEGLKSGLSAAKGLGGWIGSNVTGQVVGWLKSGLGVNSPSTITIDIGADVIEGLERGLDKARELGGWVQGNVVAPILGTLKSAFGIGSPSKVTRGYGEDIERGPSPRARDAGQGRQLLRGRRRPQRVRQLRQRWRHHQRVPARAAIRARHRRDGVPRHELGAGCGAGMTTNRSTPVGLRIPVPVRGYERGFDWTYELEPLAPLRELVPVVLDGLWLNTGDQGNGLCVVVENLGLGWTARRWTATTWHGSSATAPRGGRGARAAHHHDHRRRHRPARPARPVPRRAGHARGQPRAGAAGRGDWDLQRVLTADVRAGTELYRHRTLGATGFKYQLSLTAADPALYLGTWQTATLSNITEDTTGRDYPREYPWAYASPYISNQATLRNDGNYPAPVHALYTGDLSRSGPDRWPRRAGAGGRAGQRSADPRGHRHLDRGGRAACPRELHLARQPPDVDTAAQHRRWFLRAAGQGSIVLAWRSTWV